MFVHIAPENSALFKFIFFKYTSYLVSRKIKTRPEKLSLQIMVTNLCNLNCKRCTTYSPVVQNPYRLDVSKYKEDIARLAVVLGGEAQNIHLMGGEVLTHPDIAEIISITREAFPDSDLFSVTNGILLPKMDERFWKSCHDSDISLQITPYPIKIDHERIMELATQYRVDVEHFVSSVGYKPKEFFRKHTLDATGSCDASRSFSRCCLYDCQVMRDGKIYRCASPCLIGTLNDYFGTKFEVSEKDYVDIYKVNSKEEIFDFLAKPVPFCRYCDMDKWEFGLPWEVSKKQLDEWV